LETQLLDIKTSQEKALRQEWRTPEDFWTVLNAEFRFEMDVAASAENALCTEYLTEDEDALTDEVRWGSGNAYCNPGFANLMPWMQKAFNEAMRMPQRVVVVMGLVSPSTKWWNFCVRNCHEIRLVSPRVQFVPPPGIKKSSNARENAIFVFRTVPLPIDWQAKIRTWEWKGEREK
jgi:phage N-6-adenine-methyltransferase